MFPRRIGLAGGWMIGCWLSSTSICVVWCSTIISSSLIASNSTNSGVSPRASPSMGIGLCGSYVGEKSGVSKTDKILRNNRRLRSVTLQLPSNHIQYCLLPIVWRCPWCNGYRRRKWTRWHEFKSWTRLIAFPIALIPLGKVWIKLFSLQLWVNTRTDWVLQPWWGN